VTINARFVHTNLVARDWRRLARFYEQVFGCTPVPPERDLSGQWLEDATGKVVSVEVAGVGTITFAYLTDPEGNVIEVQRWEKIG
jgi:predicted enzyme related to lactoylglutathione lyase